MENMKYFVPQEFIPKELWDYLNNKFGNGALGMRYINPKIIVFMEWLRETLGKPITINTWYLNLPPQYTFDGRCLRLPSDKQYRISSDHNYSMAIDFDVQGMAAEDVRQLVLNTYATQFLALGGVSMEKGTNWVHVGFAVLTDGWSADMHNGIAMVNVV